MPIATNRFFVDPSAGNDGNDGRDLLGLTLVNATYDHTGNGEGERHLSSVGAFSAYTFAAGDKIYLLNAVGGVAVGLYEVASKVDADAILLTADSGLTADSTTDVDSSSGPWVTLQFAADTCLAGEDCHLSNSATETTATTVAFDTNLGDTTSGPIRFIACDSAGDRLTTGHYVLQASSSITNLVSSTTAARFIHFEGIDFDGNADTVSGDLIECATANALLSSSFSRCKLHDAGGNGSTIRSGAFIQFVDCEIYNLTIGLRPQSTAATRWVHAIVNGCRIHDNSSHGLGNIGAQFCRFSDNEIYDNGGDGINFSAAGAAYSVIVGNTIYGNTGDGIDFASHTGDQILDFHNNTMATNGGYGVRMGSSFTPRYMDYNHTHGNSSGATDATAGMPGDNNQTGDPEFLSKWVLTGCTWTEASTRLTKTGAFSNAIAGNTIRISGGTGATPDLYEITAVDVSNNYVDLAVSIGAGADGQTDITTAYDFAVHSDSPMFANGLLGRSIGARAHNVDYPTEANVTSGIDYSNTKLTGSSAGGGGLLTHPGMSGGMRG